MSSLGMQYRQRNWQASVTLTRSARSVRPKPSTRGPSPWAWPGAAPLPLVVPFTTGRSGTVGSSVDGSAAGPSPYRARGQRRLHARVGA